MLKIPKQISLEEQDDYDKLPASIKALYSRRQWRWLGDERDRVVTRETEPDWDVIE